MISALFFINFIIFTSFLSEEILGEIDYSSLVETNFGYFKYFIEDSVIENVTFYKLTSSYKQNNNF